MLTQVGYSKPGIAIETLEDGSLLANGIRITAPGGWMKVESSPFEILKGAPTEFAVQLRSIDDTHGVSFMVVQEIEIESRRHADLAALALALGGDIEWLGHVASLVHREIAYAVRPAHRQTGPRAIVPVAIAANTSADVTARLRPLRMVGRR
jgi:hypothetical protein